MLIIFLLCTFLFGIAFISAVQSQLGVLWVITFLLGVAAAISFGGIKAAPITRAKR